MSFKVAIASNDGKYVNEHFGKTSHFFIFEIKKDGSHEFLEIRENIPPYEELDYDNLKNHDNLLEKSINLILDCEIVLASQIGPKAIQILLSNGASAYQIDISIDKALRRLASSNLVLSSNQNRIGKLFKAEAK